ncbi:MAG: phasin family protein, partial [Betaproteobacteria bacterium]
MLNTIQYKTNQVGETVLAASRQMWLAGLGAAVVTRDWAEREAGGVMRTLVREGTAVESRAFRIVGNQVETSIDRANHLWKKTRATVETTVRTYADTAVALVRQTLPKSLP